MFVVGWVKRQNIGLKTDPFYMVMLSKNLGNHYVVWDKAATIEFKNRAVEQLVRNVQLQKKSLKILKMKWIDWVNLFLIVEQNCLMKKMK